MIDDGRAMLWLGVVAVGAYHGLNPAMGWPLAVANGMTERRGSAVLATFVPLGAGHLLAMLLVLLPYALLGALLAWQRELRIAAAALVLLFGAALLLRRRRHPRWLARVKPTRLLLWSLLMATAHGAALMLLPMLMGLCRAPADALGRPPGAFTHAGVMALMAGDLGTAVAVALLHTASMVGAGLAGAWLVYRCFGLRALRSGWFDLDRVWAASLIAAGGTGIAMAV